MILIKQLSIESIVSAKSTLEEDLYKKYLKTYNIELKDHEVSTLDKLKDMHPFIIKYNFYFGYKIPQLGKEFDLLIFNDKQVLNIEIKSESSIDKIKKQLMRNLFYLESLELEIELLSFDASREEIFKLNLKNHELETISSEEFKLILKQYVKNKEQDLDALFLPSKYLISPFNNTEKFFEDRYLLTSQQEKISNDIQSKLKANKFEITLIEGNPGTGKTLLTYHVAKEIANMKKVLIIHCGNLNPGHNDINQMANYQELQLRIIPIKSIKNVNIKEYDLLIIDEGQRIYPNQLEYIKKEVKENEISTIFSYDPRQTLSEKESNSGAVESIRSISRNQERLTDKIRTNKELAAFIKNLFNLREASPNIEYKNITLEYFTCPKKLRLYLLNQVYSQWNYIEYTNSFHNVCSYDSYQADRLNNSHSVIGQEFSKVVVVIDPSFYYEESKLRSNGYTGGTGYSQEKMLYQNITRVRSELKIVILNNEEMFKKVLNILNPDPKNEVMN